MSTALITGATDGLGRAVARELARRGLTVHLHGRDAGRLRETRAEIEAAVPGARLHEHRADLAALSEVRALADAVLASAPELHLLINNAGIGSGRADGAERQESRDGIELRLAVNHLAGFVLTLRLLDRLRASAPARVVHVASLGQAPLDFDDPQLERGYDGSRAYAQSKLAQIGCGMELAARVDPEQVTVASLHPATYMPTKMVLEAGGRKVDELQTGVDATVRVATDPELVRITGRFYDRGHETQPDGWALDPDNRRRLWELSLALTGEPDL